MGILEFLLVQSVVNGIKKSSDSAALEKQEEALQKAADEAGLPLAVFVKNQLSPTMRETIDRIHDDPEKLEHYLQTCVNQKLLSKVFFDLIWEEEKGQCALRRLQATGGNPWHPHNILVGLAPENILKQCDKDADNYGLQLVYLDQQVYNEKVTRKTADLILNIYKLAREE